MKNLIFSIVLLLSAVCSKAQQPISFTPADKTKIESIFTKFATRSNESPQTLIVALARYFIGVPYVAKTLEVNDNEQLIINLRQLDCTTFVENVMAAYLCIKTNKLTFNDFAYYLRQVRYADGNVSYPTRLHYFSEWIDQNTRKQYVCELQQPNPPFTSMQQININYMSTHTSLYPMLVKHPEMISDIKTLEKMSSGKHRRYIPKETIRNNALFRSTIHNGDIIAITTKKKGLDTSHIGFAVWHKDGLHLLNASQIHKKVVEEPMTLYQYMQKHTSQVGIRIVRINNWLQK